MVTGQSPPGHVRVCWAGDAHRMSASFVSDAGFPRPCLTSCEGCRRANRIGRNATALPVACVCSDRRISGRATDIPARGLQFLILTGTRSGDIIGQKRNHRSPQLGEHIDLAARLSTIPVTKNDSEHIVLLSDAALAVLTEIGLEPGEPVFPNNRGGLLSTTAMAAVIRRMNKERKREGKPQWTDPKQGFRQVLPHGFRATFRTWVDEQTNFSRELGEKALAHTVGDETERSYQRGELLAKAQAVDECMGRALRRGQSAGGEQRHATAQDCWQNKYVEHQ
jgi:hypothetical protein